MEILVAWIGRADLDAASKVSEGPILGALLRRPFRRLQLLADWPDDEVAAYLAWLHARAPAVAIDCHRATLSNPNAFGEIYRAAIAAVDAVLRTAGARGRLTFHISPGTPAMASVWLILSKTRYEAELVESSTGSLNSVEAPFDLAAELLPDLLLASDRRLAAANAERPGVGSRFGDIWYRSDAMTRVIALARKAAARSVPLLIEGESGTGKELLARAIHAESPRHDRSMIVVNCGAIPRELVESRLFGHRKGAFTGAVADQAGCFEDADQGTLFLDEIGELPLEAQVKLLRIVEDGEVVRIGESRSRRVNVRIMTATNRDLLREVAAGNFREDLFYRLAVLPIVLPPLREREGDVGWLIDRLLKRLLDEMRADGLMDEKVLSAGARRLLLSHSWPGNVRELQNTLRRSIIWSDTKTIQEEDVSSALLSRQVIRPVIDDIFNKPLGNGFSLDSLLDSIAESYIRRAMEKTGGSKTKAARLIGFKSHQRLVDWMRRLSISI